MLSLVFLAGSARAGDGDLAAPPAAHGHEAQATVGDQCPPSHQDPCKSVNVTGGRPQCQGGEWVCVGGCSGGPPPCAAGKSGQCVEGQWQCVVTEASCSEPQPSCGIILRPVCVGSQWQCWTPKDQGCAGEPPACSPTSLTARQGAGSAAASCVNGQWSCPGADPGAFGGGDGRLTTSGSNLPAPSGGGSSDGGSGAFGSPGSNGAATVQGGPSPRQGR